MVKPSRLREHIEKRKYRELKWCNQEEYFERRSQAMMGKFPFNLNVKSAEKSGDKDVDIKKTDWTGTSHRPRCHD